MFVAINAIIQAAPDYCCAFVQVSDLQMEVAKTGTELREAISAATTAREAAERSEVELRSQLSMATTQAEQLNNQLLSVKAAAFDSHLAERNSR